MAKKKIPLERRTYRSTIDGTDQPYTVYLPARLRRRRRSGGLHPLVVLLHGFGGNELSGVDRGITRLCDRHGTILLVPRGRGSVFFDGPGEVDVQVVLERTVAEFPVDPDRVFLLGASMGGSGAMRLGARCPDRFAGIVAICGWADPRVWYAHWYGPAGREDLVHPAHRPLLAQSGNVCLAANFRSLPLILMQGARDRVVYVQNARRMYRAAKQSGIALAYREFARSGHKGFASRWARVFRWMDGAGFDSWVGRRLRGCPPVEGPRRRVKSPSQVVYYSDGIHHTRAYWLEVLRDPNDPYARVGVRAAASAGGDEIAVALDGAAGVRIELDHAPCKRTGSVRVRLDRKGRGPKVLGAVPPNEVIVVTADGDLLTGRDAQPTRDSAAPRGAMVEAFRSPFLLVKPSRGPDAAEAERFCRHWTSWLIPHDEDGEPLGRPRIKRDTQVTLADRKRYNLICFGRPAENRELARVARKLPFEITKDRIAIAGKTHRGAHIGLRAITRNPDHPARYLAAFVGSSGQRIKDLEAIGWYWPEYAVIDTGKPMRHTNHDDWGPFERRVAAGEIDLEQIDPDHMPIRYLPDRWLDAGMSDSLWK